VTVTTAAVAVPALVGGDKEVCGREWVSEVTAEESIAERLACSA